MKMYVLFMAAACLCAQDDQPGTIEGIIRAEGGGPPQADVDVRAGDVEARTDTAGRYTLRVPPGRHRVFIGFMRNSPVAGSRLVAVTSGKTVTANFNLPLKATISGKVIDHNEEPVPGVEVALIGREYNAGALRYYRKSAVFTNDEGEYRMSSVRPGVSYLLLFRKLERQKIRAISDAPTEPKSRRPAVVPTYYPGSAEPEGGSLVILRGGEHREAVNVRLLRAPSFCAEGLLTNAGRPAALTFQIHEAHLSFGLGLSGGITGLPPMGQSGNDGRIRLCDLHPGEYRLTALSGDLNIPDSLSTVAFTIRDRDLQNIAVQLGPRFPPLPVEIDWAGKPPEKPISAKVGLSLLSTTRSFGAFAGAAPAPIPVRSQIKDNSPASPGMLVDDYILRVNGLTGSTYLNEVTYGTANLKNEPFRPGTAPTGVPVRILVGHDGATVKVHAADREGNAMPYASVIVMPAEYGSDAELAATLITGEADQFGDYVSRAVRPGKYLLLASATEAIDAGTPEFIARLRSARNAAVEVVLEPNSTVEVSVVVSP